MDPEDITVLLDLLVFFFFQVIIVYTFEIVYVNVWVNKFMSLGSG